MSEPTARDYMATRLVTFTPDMDIHQAIGVLLKHKISGAPVLDTEGNLIGILSKKDCLKVAFSDAYLKSRSGPVGDYMSTEVETVDVDTGIVEVAERFLRGTFRRFPVLDGNELVGLITRHDVLKALRSSW